MYTDDEKNDEDNCTDTQNDDGKDDDNMSSMSSELEIDLEKQKENKLRVQKMLDNMSNEELHRYESFRRAGFNKSGIRKICNTMLNQACNANFVISVAGIAKVFAGEMVEKAKEVQNEWGDKGALLPSHIHEAYRRLYKTMPNLKRANKNCYF